MSNNIKTTVEELRKLVNVDNVIGSPIETEDKILIPVIRMGVGFGAGENNPGEENNRISATGAGAGVEPISMVMIPKKGNDAEGVRVLDLAKGTETNKAISDIGLVISDLIKSYMDSMDIMVHSVGHGVGLNIHERPFSSKNGSDKDLLLPGAVFTIEPGLYYPDNPEGYGIRIEDTYYMDKDGKVSPLTEYPYRLIIDVPAK